MSSLRKRMLAVVLMTVAVLGLSAAVVYANGKHHGPKQPGKHHRHHGQGAVRIPAVGDAVRPLGLRAGDQVHARAQHGQHVPADLHGVERAGRADRGAVRRAGTSTRRTTWRCRSAHKTLYIAWLNPDPRHHRCVRHEPQDGRRLRLRAGQRVARELGHGADRDEGREPHPVGRADVSGDGRAGVTNGGAGSVAVLAYAAAPPRCVDGSAGASTPMRRRRTATPPRCEPRSRLGVVHQAAHELDAAAAVGVAGAAGRGRPRRGR